MKNCDVIDAVRSSTLFWTLKSFLKFYAFIMMYSNHLRVLYCIANLDYLTRTVFGWRLAVLRTGAVNAASGSAYAEFGNTKVIVSV